MLAGGDSPERGISLISGMQVVSALEGAGHEPTWIDPAEVGLATVEWHRFDACFIALHGGAGEDGRVQRQLDRLGVPYTGSGPTASRLAMSKSAAKERFLQAGVPTPDYVLLQASESPAVSAGKCAALGYPLVVKPDSSGSSLGVSVARGPSDLRDCLAASFALDPFVVAERFVCGREFTMSLLEREPLPLLEVAVPPGNSKLFSFDAKYSNPETQYRFDTGLAAEVAANLSRTAVAAAAALETRGLVRVDLMLDESLEPWVFEVTTVPGLTGRCLAPQAAARAGIDMARLCNWMVHDCLTRETVA